MFEYFVGKIKIFLSLTEDGPYSTLFTIVLNLVHNFFYNLVDFFGDFSIKIIFNENLIFQLFLKLLVHIITAY